MRIRLCAATLLAAVMPFQAAVAQGVVHVPTGNSARPVSVTPPPSDDTPEEIAADAQRDLRDSRFYNRPGATRAQYDSDWQDCRLIARGSRTPSGMVPVYYNPAVISPLAAGVGGALGGLIAGAIAEGQQRRANRRNCLLIRGWRLVDVPGAEAARVREMTDAQRSDYFNTIVGAERVEGSITERTSFSLAPDPMLNLDGPVPLPGAIFLGRRVDPAVPLALAPGEGAMVFAFRRPDEGSAGRTAEVHFARYDIGQRDLIYQPRDWRSRGDTTTYRMNVISRDRRAPLEVHVMKVTPGDYVIAGHVPGLVPVTNSFCFGAPTFHVGAGEVVYVGDFVPFMNAQMSTGDRLTAMAYTSNIEDSRRTLAAQQPALAAALAPATLRNGATYACSAVTMDRWDIAGLESLGLPEPAAEPAPATEPASAPAAEPAAEPATEPAAVSPPAARS
jgi:hypothetical protein